MGVLPALARQLMAVSGFALAIAAPLGVVIATTPSGPPAYLAQCNGGEEPDTFTTTCVPFMAPRTPGTSAMTAGASTCPPGVSGTECGTQGNGPDAINPQAAEAERTAAGTEQIGQDVAEAAGGLDA